MEVFCCFPSLILMGRSKVLTEQRLDTQVTWGWEGAVMEKLDVYMCSQRKKYFFHRYIIIQVWAVMQKTLLHAKKYKCGSVDEWTTWFSKPHTKLFPKKLQNVPTLSSKYAIFYDHFILHTLNFLVHCDRAALLQEGCLEYFRVHINGVHNVGSLSRSIDGNFLSRLHL